MSERDKSKDEEAFAVIKAIDATIVFCAAWTLWKGKHDVDSLELNCCEASKTLHATANSLEKAVRELILNEQFIEHVFGPEIAAIVIRESKRIVASQLLKDAKASQKH